MRISTAEEREQSRRTVGEQERDGEDASLPRRLRASRERGQRGREAGQEGRGDARRPCPGCRPPRSACPSCRPCSSWAWPRSRRGGPVGAEGGRAVSCGREERARAGVDSREGAHLAPLLAFLGETPLADARHACRRGTREGRGARWGESASRTNESALLCGRECCCWCSLC